jgi:pyridinium-3,5-biscarboxylic acid mononucleotide sulfurtransferase
MRAECEAPPETPEDGENLSALKDRLRAMESVVVAFSGGTDSAFLMAVAHEVLAGRSLAVTGVSASLPERDREDAARMAGRYGWAHRVIETGEMANPRFTENPPDRCYHCKSDLFGRLRRLADAEGYRWVLDGSNLDDRGDVRPGTRARDEWGVRSPLQEAGFDKAAVRRASRRMGLETADKPAAACLASRFPYGARITPDALKAVERAEAALRDLGFVQVRVRAHGDVARIEVAPADMPRAVEAGLSRRIAEAVRSGGFRYVALDLEGYRTGSMNEALGR